MNERLTLSSAANIMQAFMGFVTRSCTGYPIRDRAKTVAEHLTKETLQEGSCHSNASIALTFVYHNLKGLCHGSPVHFV